MGRTARGVKALSLEPGDEVVGMEEIREGATLLTITEKGFGRRSEYEEYRLQSRGGKGVIATAITEKTGELACMKLCDGSEDIMLIRDDGTIIRLPVEQISVTARNTQGVRLMRVDEGTRVVSVALVPHDEEEPEGAAAQKGEAEPPQSEA